MSTAINGNDWKDAVESVLERLKYLLESGHESDVEFLVGNEATGIESIKAHKFVLGTISSSVFDAQFRANEANGLPLDEPIKVIDVEPSAFKAMLKFLYSNDLSGINKENIAAVLATAKKYLLLAFTEKCVELAFELLDTDNAFGLLKVADLHDEKILVEHCRTFIDENIADIVEKSDEFLVLNQEEIAKLFTRDTLHSDELKLFKGLDRWAQKQCEDKEIKNPTGEQKRAVIGSALDAIRFPLITPEDFANQIVSTAIVNEKEIAAMFMYKFGANEKVKAAHRLPFSTYFRRTTNQWKEHGCSTNLTISACGLVVTHSGPEIKNTVLATMPVPKMNLNSKKASIAFYFEVQILKKTQRGIEIGFCDGEIPLKGHSIGERINSIGIYRIEYMNIDGFRISLRNGLGNIKEGDVIGMGLIHSPANSSIQYFATYNGALLDKVDLSSKFVGLQLFPAASLYQEGNSIKANFGREAWHYNPCQLINE